MNDNKNVMRKFFLLFCKLVGGFYFFIRFLCVAFNKAVNECEITRLKWIYENLNDPSIEHVVVMHTITITVTKTIIEQNMEKRKTSKR